MANKHKIAEPIYQKIAIDIASKIAAGKYKAGEKIYGRSMLAAHYAVSPETIRRAMFMQLSVNSLFRKISAAACQATCGVCCCALPADKYKF